MQSALEVTARLIQFAAATVLFGAPLFFLYGLRARSGDMPARLGWPRWGLFLAGATLLFAAAASLCAQTASMTGEPAAAFQPASLWEVLAGTQFGLAIAARMGLATAALIHGLMVRPSRLLWAVLAGLGAGALASFAWTGHGGANDGVAGIIHLGADIIHLLAAGVWLGALAVLAALLTAARPSPDRWTLQTLHRGLEGFSGVGTAVVALLLLTGLVNSWFLIGPTHLGALWTTAYGLLLGAKILVFAGMLGLAAINRFRLTPGLGAALAAAPPQAALAALRRSILLETVAAIAILALVSLLGTLAPPAAMD
ncbi:copper homeostasis membrane protein CopD [Phenylobacterium aquaticum]|uniref:copper homeostasis membrane protein CopD n=1 Tax=Phenylobacterium aquaticum TaxID=1763816 RepID=UPI001F5DB822|nr:copper homeostasis membrane protein CopD [Phenylobacterium aquaticum]MCI3132795.1 copper homeostasis membrane protein CopD [Phenylobacterium aquaticum]